jgi:HK97 gp10 family phage protein
MAARDRSKAVHGLVNFKAHGMAIEGMEELVENLTGLLPREVKNLTRAAVHGVAGEVQKGMRQRAPKDTGTLRKAIVTHRRRGTETQVASDVIITHGKGQKNDAWYWHFVEWGTQLGQVAQPFVNPTVEEMRPKFPEIMREQVGKKLEALMRRKARTK